MAETKRYEHWTLKINDNDTRKDIIEALLQLPEDVKADLTVEHFGKVWLRFQRDEQPRS